MRMISQPARFSAGLILFLVAVLGGAWDWPVEGGRIVTVFGSVREGEVVPGILITEADAEVEAAASGESILAFDVEECSHCLPSVLGSVVVLHHQRGFRTVYAHLDSVSLPELSVAVSGGDSLGLVGNSGAALGRRLYFAVIDARRNVTVNPLLILPSLGDDHGLRIEDVQLVEVDEMPNRRRIVVTAVDEVSGAPVLPFAFELLIDGQLQREITFDVIRIDEEAGVAVADGGRRIADVVRPDGSVDLGVHAVVPGLTEVEIVVRDPEGNSSTRRLRVPPAPELPAGPVGPPSAP